MHAENLDDLLVAAGEAPPESRIQFRDRIAAHGLAAINRLMAPVWIGDQNYAAFAIRTIKRAGEVGAHDEAVSALRSLLSSSLSDIHRTDVFVALEGLGVKATSRATGQVNLPKVGITGLLLEELVVGKAYSRTELHDSFGGNRQRGISYPANGDHCLLFSDPSKESEHGYGDAPVGEDGYRYFGEWDGPGDMTMAGGNRVVLDRSPELYLFTTASRRRVFLGRYSCDAWGTERTARDGHSRQAIVFQLRRVPK